MEIFAWIVARFIPAGAGNTSPGRAMTPAHPVYPRWRGEHPKPAITNNSAHGLSPLARGTLIRSAADNSQNRFIPASAGNTSGDIHLHDLEAGLSPLARGTQHGGNIAPLTGRFIPAGAGNTPELPPGLIEVTVYPRWRGEHANKLRFYGSLNGLSPLARGTRSSPTR